MHGDMGYLAREDRLARRRNLNVILPGVQSIIMVGLDYHALQLPAGGTAALNDPSRGRIAAYAWGSDYHDIMAEKLEQLAAWLHEASGQHTAHRVYVDTGAILERSHAQQAGVGFIGKNTMLINSRRGSYFFLGELLTDIVFDAYDPAHRETMCGTCNRCRAACPTNAFPQPYVLDARRCISCQDVCPFSRFVVPTREPAFIPTSLERAAPSLLDLLALDADEFHAHFNGSPIVRVGRDRMVRNACVAAGNWGSKVAVPALESLLHDPNLLVRGHAVWALGQLGEHSTLAALLDNESDPQVRDEIQIALQQQTTGA